MKFEVFVFLQSHYACLNPHSLITQSRKFTSDRFSCNDRPEGLAGIKKKKKVLALSQEGPSSSLSRSLSSHLAACQLLVFGQYFIRSLHVKQRQAVAVFVWGMPLGEGRPSPELHIRCGMFVLFQSTLGDVPFLDALLPLFILTFYPRFGSLVLGSVCFDEILGSFGLHKEISLQN